jgi:hypothetical protein
MEGAEQEGAGGGIGAVNGKVGVAESKGAGKDWV